MLMKVTTMIIADSRNKREGRYCGKIRGKQTREGVEGYHSVYTRLHGKFLYDKAFKLAVKLGWINL